MAKQKKTAEQCKAWQAFNIREIKFKCMRQYAIVFIHSRHNAVQPGNQHTDPNTAFPSLFKWVEDLYRLLLPGPIRLLSPLSLRLSRGPNLWRILLPSPPIWSKRVIWHARHNGLLCTMAKVQRSGSLRYYCVSKPLPIKGLEEVSEICWVANLVAARL